MPLYTFQTEKSSLLKIGIIGDSWVAENKLDSILHKKLLKQGIQNKVISSGKPGAKSRSIYQNLFKKKNDKYSSKFIIENNPDYCILILGVNDAASQIGSPFYAFHMVQVIVSELVRETLPSFDKVLY